MFQGRELFSASGPVPGVRPGPEAISSALGRIVQSASLVDSPRLRAFLRFIVERTLAGEARSLKAYTIGVGALGRDANFDPNTDAIVRVEAVRLRTALERYYDGDCASDPVLIDLPRGTYVPQFHWRKAPIPQQASPRNGSSEEHRRATSLIVQCSAMKARSHIAFAELKAEIATARSLLLETKLLLRSRLPK